MHYIHVDPEFSISALHAVNNMELNVIIKALIGLGQISLYVLHTIRSWVHGSIMACKFEA